MSCASRWSWPRLVPRPHQRSLSSLTPSTSLLTRGRIPLASTNLFMCAPAPVHPFFLATCALRQQEFRKFELNNPWNQVQAGGTKTPAL